MKQKIIDFIKREIKPCNSLFVLGAYTIFALIFTYPLIIYITKYAVGDLEGDMWKHLWGFWWVKRRILHDGVLPLFTNLLNYPYGGSLFFIDPLGALIALPLQLFLPAALVYNLLVLFNLVFGAYAGYLLAGYFIKNRAAAFYSGAVFSFTAYMLAYITSGVSETFNYGWVALFLYFYARMLNENRETLAILAGITFFTATLGSWYYGSFSTQIGILFFIAFSFYLYRKVVPRQDTRKRNNLTARLNLDFLGGKKEGLAVKDAIKGLPTRKKSAGPMERFFGIRSDYRSKKKVLGFRDWLLQIFSYFTGVFILLGVFYLLYLTSKISQSPRSQWLEFFIVLAFVAGGIVFLLWRYRDDLKKLSYTIQGYYSGRDPEVVRRRMYILFAFYGISILGVNYLYNVMHQDTPEASFRVGALVLAVTALSGAMTYMEIKGSSKPAGRKKAGSGQKEDSPADISNLKNYASILFPWLILALSFINFIRISVFYQQLYEVFGQGYINTNLIIASILFTLSLVYIIRRRLFQKLRIFRRLYMEPDLPKGADPALAPKIIRRNILITGILALSVSIPPVILFIMGFSPHLYARYWIAFTLAIASVGTLVLLLSKKTSPVISGDQDEVPTFFTFLRVLFKGPLRKILIMSIIAMALIGPLFYTFRASLDVSQGLVKRERSIEFIELYLSKRFHNVSRLIDYVQPGKENVTRTYTVDRLTRSSYAGWIALALALTSAAISRRRKFYWFWLVSAVLFIMFSLGPYLYVTESIHLKDLFPLYRWLYLYFPFFNQISIPYRFNIMAMLCISILAGYGICALTRSWDRTTRNVAVIALALATLFEVVILSPGPYPIPLSDLRVPEFYRQIARDEDEYGIIDSPIQRVKGELLCGEYFYYQMIHNKGIPYKVEGTIPVYIYENQFTVYLFNLEKGYAMSPPDKDILVQYLLELKKNKIKYIVVHNQYLRPSARERVHQYLTHFIGEPEITDMDLHIYRIY